MRLLVFPDIHHAENVATEVEAAIERENPDVAVFLGDYFDQYHDTPWDAERTARWLKQSLSEPKRVHLLGNHDLAYRFPHASAGHCPGFTVHKAAAINSVLTPADWVKLSFSFWHENLLCSHAGWSAHFTPTGYSEVPPLRHYLDGQENAAVANLQQNEPHWIYMAGRRRGGVGPAGGLLWCDVREFKSIPGINQLFGHTPGNLGTVVKGDRSLNVCIDTTDQLSGVRHYIRADCSERPWSVTVCEIRGTAVKQLQFS